MGMNDYDPDEVEAYLAQELNSLSWRYYKENPKIKQMFQVVYLAEFPTIEVGVNLEDYDIGNIEPFIISDIILSCQEALTLGNYDGNYSISIVNQYNELVGLHANISL